MDPSQPPPNHPDAPATDSSTHPSAPEIRYEVQPILVPAEMVPPEETPPPAYSIPIPTIHQQQDAYRVAPPAHSDVPQDFRVPWRWTDVILFAIFYLGSAIVAGVVLIVIAAAIMHTRMQDLAGDKAFAANIAILAQTIGSGLSLIYLWVLVRARHGGPFWRTMGWRPLEHAVGRRTRPWLFVLSGIGLAVIVGLVDQYYVPQHPLPMEEMFQTRQTMILLALFGVLIAPFIEETIFRGFLYPVVGRSFGVAAAIIVTGAIFGLTHAQQLWGGWGQIGLIVLVGIVLTWVRARRQTVLASFLIHISYNSTIFAVLLISTGGFRHIHP